MKNLLSVLLARILGTPAARTAATEILAVGLGPQFRVALGAAGGAVDPLMVRAILVGAGQLLAGTTPTYVAIAPYTAAEQQQLVEQFAALTRALLTSLALPVPTADLEQLLGAVAERIAAPVPAVTLTA